MFAMLMFGAAVLLTLNWNNLWDDAIDTNPMVVRADAVDTGFSEGPVVVARIGESAAPHSMAA